MEISGQTRLYRPIGPVACLLLGTVLGLQCHRFAQPVADGFPSVSETVHDAAATPAESDEIGQLARRDPETFLLHCRDAYDRRNVRDYTCSFTTQELIGGRLTPVQEASVRFREKPFSVDMKWTRNATVAKRALYVENAWIDARGRELAWFKPAGVLIKLFVPRIKQPIDGPSARAASRRTLDQFGFRRTLGLIIKYNQRGRRNGDLEISYIGQGSINDRATFVFERRLPFSGQEEPYPDGLLRYHMDQEWLIPTACFSYADAEGAELLGSYIITDVQFNIVLDDDDFDPQQI